MRKRSAVTTAALSLFGVFILGCAIPEPAPFDPGDPVDPTTATSTAQASPDATTTRSSMEGAYTYSTMDEYVDQVVVEYMNPWLNETWPGMREPFVQYVDSGDLARQPRSLCAKRL